MEFLEKKFTVKPEHSAVKVSSGAVDVLSTPCLIAFMEDASFTLLQEKLGKGLTSVGYHVDVKHLAPAPIGAEILVRSTILKEEGKRVTFKVEAFYKDKKIAEGIHERVIVNEEEFMKKVE
ncbi:thioesterase [Acidianus infernus]|uniref:Thioesterase n=1 Tax=Acidianus infernus TaxID=12915 RepID=A0A6A9QK04_ACIIN|nr:thioesterase family protein [Acidianus infernus]MCY0874014.1 thioesterase family protein [Acidianus infernus]MUM65526.1 thioesterase [Acidianus infernus]